MNKHYLSLATLSLLAASLQALPANAGRTDTAPPTVSAFDIPATSSSLTIPVNTFTATDNVGVTGYLIAPSSTTYVYSTTPGWSATKPTTYTVPSEGSHILCGWAKDKAGNVSSLFCANPVDVTLPAQVTEIRPYDITRFLELPYPGSLGTNDGEKGLSVGTDANGNVYVAATSETANGYILKYSGSDNQLRWQIPFDLPATPKNPDVLGVYESSNGLSAIAVDAAGNVYAAGTLYNRATPDSRFDCVVSKYDTNGILQWMKAYDYAYSHRLTTKTDELCNDIAIDKDGNIIVGGMHSLDTSGSSFENLLLQFNSSGTLLRRNIWSKTASRIRINDCYLTCQSQIRSLTTLADGTIAVLGKYGTSTRFIKKYAPSPIDSSLLEQQPNTTPIKLDSAFYPGDIIANSRGNIFVGGSQWRDDNNSGIVDDGDQKQYKIVSYPATFSATPRCQWAEPIGNNPEYDWQTGNTIWGLTTVADGSIYMAGSLVRHLIAMKYGDDCQPLWLDGSGALMPLISYPSTNYVYNTAFGVAVDNNKNLIMTGDRAMVGGDPLTVKFLYPCSGYTTESECSENMTCEWYVGLNICTEYTP